ncbi:MAG: ubiquinol-cytochrome c reductase iron-sulfur subunit [Actinomycetota bacterium]
MKPVRWVYGSFVVSMVASLVLVAYYFLGESAQVEGILLGLSLGGMGIGIVGWATRLMDIPETTEERQPFAPTTPEPERSEDIFGRQPVSRRRMLLGLAGGAGATLGGALAIPALSLGPRPGESLEKTKWTVGARVVDRFGNPQRPRDIPLNGIKTVFPSGFEGSADSQTVVIKIEPELLDLPGERQEWAPEGCVAFSKICTHSGCPVGLYRAQARQLLCPCHQSTFDVTTGCQPVFGPAARALPQLPLDVDDAGFLIATGDFPEPVGPSFWNMETE